jgi:hypothetical protein
MTKEKIKHLEFIQNVITRMNKNSFQLKGWTVTIVSAILAIYVSTKNCYFVLSGIFPTVIFWFLDAYYLTQERKFRGLYNDVAEITGSPKLIKPFEMSSELYIGGEYSFWSSFFSITILKIYLSISSALILLFIYFMCFHI